ncbi:MAG: NADP-dependent oxidoreductase [Sulfitobacter sp.]
MSDQMQSIVLASRPDGTPTPDNFRLESAPLPTQKDGEVLVRVHYFSLDPYMRGRMDAGKSYTAPIPVGGLMEGGAVGQVIASGSPDFALGDYVAGYFGWATHSCQPAQALTRLDPTAVPITAALGVLGMPGFTGWFGLNEYGRPRAGETLVVAAATGPVGSIVGQLAKSLGLRVVGIAGGAEKCALATDSFGFDACVDHRAFANARDLRAALKSACPDGVDIYFENVGGKVLEAIVPLMNPNGRIPLCGMVSWYNAGGLGAQATDSGLSVPGLWRAILVKFLSVNGFIISNHWSRYPDFLAEVTPKVAAGTIVSQEDIAEGLENAPQVFIDMLSGGNFGKQIVKVV